MAIKTISLKMIVGFVWLIVMANGHLKEATRTSIKYSCNYMCAVMHCMQILWLGVKLKLQLTVFIEMINFLRTALRRPEIFLCTGSSLRLLESGTQGYLLLRVMELCQHLQLTSQIIVIMMLMMMTTMADAGVTVASQVLGT